MTGPNRRLRPDMRPPVYERNRGMVYGIAVAYDASGAVTKWLCDQEGRVMLWVTRDSALEGNDDTGWRGEVLQYPSGVV